MSQNLKVIAEYGSVSKILEDIKTEGGEIKEIQFVLISPDELGKKAAEIFPDAPAPISDAYIILSEGDKLTAYSSTKAGLHFAAGAIKRHILCGGIKEGEIYNTPDVPFRCVKMYLPAREDIPVFFEIIELCVALGCNAVMLEIGGAMEYKLHPEINEGWVEYCDMFQDEPAPQTNSKLSSIFIKTPYIPKTAEAIFSRNPSPRPCRLLRGTVWRSSQRFPTQPLRLSPHKAQGAGRASGGPMARYLLPIKKRIL